MSHFPLRLQEILDADPVAAAVHATRQAEERRAHARPYEPVGEQFLPSLWATGTLRDARKRARRRGIEISLSVGWVLRTLESQHYCCAVSGIEFSASRPQGAHKRPFMPSLDRRDCAKGYTPDNVRIVCVVVNTLLQDWGDGVFHEIIKAARHP